VEGEYEVQAAVVDGSGTVIASAVRRVIVGSNQAPTITITSRPTTPSASAQAAVFTATATDADGDEVRRVEFYDNGILIGTDTTPDETSPGVFEFGDDIKDIEGNFYDLLRGTHDITAKVFDSRGAVGETVSASQVVITGGNARPTIDVTSPANGLIVTQGQSFTVVYTDGDPDGASDIDEVEAYDIVTNDGDIDSASPFDDLTIDTTGWEPGSHVIRVVARDASGDESYPLYLTVFVRIGSGATFAETLVANIVDEATAAPSNELFTGVQQSSSEYSGGIDSGLEIDQGIVLTSGSAALWNAGDQFQNTDERDDGAFNNNVEPGDLDLEDRVVGVRTTDAAAIEFDVFCQNGQLELDYQFGSEEYDEFVGSFNDGFMVTITRPGAISGTVASFLPDCSGIVAVNTVSQVSGFDQNEHLFLDDDLDIKPNVAPGNEDNQVEYDGMTVRLKVHAFVTPNSVYRVKIVIADTDGNNTNDDLLDSGVFVGESSLKTLLPTP
jgi:hypothetical protein